jgi:CYTH domain-containing protein
LGSFAGETWNVDIYDGILSSVVLAEIELTKPDQNLTLPDWVDQEVTHNPDCRKINMLLARRKKAPVSV